MVKGSNNSHTSIRDTVIDVRLTGPKISPLAMCECRSGVAQMLWLLAGVIACCGWLLRLMFVNFTVRWLIAVAQHFNVTTGSDGNVNYKETVNLSIAWELVKIAWDGSRSRSRAVHTSLWILSVRHCFAKRLYVYVYYICLIIPMNLT